MKRETGYYWIKFGGGWQAAFFSQPENTWFLDGGVWEEDDFQEINETRIKSPDEK